MKTIVMAVTAVLVLGAGGYGLYRVGLQQGMEASRTGPAAGSAPASASRAPQAPGDVDPASGRKVLYWHDPMVPGQKFDRPGKSPFMDMQLVPVYADSADEAGVAISPRVQQNLGVRVAEVRRGSLALAIEAVGSVAYNERDVVVVQARANGFVERLHVRAPLDPVRKGQPLAEVYVPDWVAAQEEYLSARRISRRSDVEVLAVLDGAARERMRLAGMSEEQIRAVVAGGKVQPRFTITSPISGVVGELSAREGMTVMAGAPLFRINGLSTVWVNAEIPEALATQVRPGTAVEARAAGSGGTVFKGRVSAILPEVSPATRTVKARIEVANPRSQLAPGMFVTVNFAPSQGGDVLLVPTEAVIQTGKRNVVVLAQESGRFMPVDVEVGIESNGQTEIRKGLQPGQKVVVSGQFLLDSEANLKASTGRLAEGGGTASGAAAKPAHRGEGKVESISKDEVTLSHGPIPTLKWGAMTMGFRPPAGGLPSGIAVGDTVQFEIREGAEGSFQITSISRKGAPGAASSPPAPGSPAPSGGAGGRR